MGRTRSGVLEAAAGVVAERGTKRTSMTDIAAAAGIAKGTLYNHFRTKDDVWSALAEAEVHRLASECRDLPLASALRYAAERIAAHPVARRLAEEEPAMLAALLTAGESAPGWAAAREAVSAQLTRAGADPAATDLVLRWLASHLALAAPARAEATARLLAAALPVTPLPVAPPLPVAAGLASPSAVAPGVAPEPPSAVAPESPSAVAAGVPPEPPSAGAAGPSAADAHELWSTMRAGARGSAGEPSRSAGQDERGPVAHEDIRPELAGRATVPANPGFLPFL
jgi:AcrR family transcriptional regulator